MPGRIRPAVDAVTTLAILATCVVLLYMASGPGTSRTGRSIPVPHDPVPLEGAELRGSADAPVVIVEYSDYQCPFCAVAEKNAIPAIDQAYIRTGKVSLAFRHHPIEQLHPLALKAAEAASCAGRAGKFWEMHAALFSNPKDLQESSLLARARRINMDMARFAACLAGETTSRVRQEAKGAELLGLNGTPVFLIGARRSDGRVSVSAVIQGARPFQEFAKAIDAALLASDGKRGWSWILVSLGSVLGGAASLWFFWRTRVSRRQAEHSAPVALGR